jgi:hypothetical protein
MLYPANYYALWVSFASTPQLVNALGSMGAG